MTCRLHTRHGAARNFRWLSWNCTRLCRSTCRERLERTRGGLPVYRADTCLCRHQDGPRGATFPPYDSRAVPGHLRRRLAAWCHDCRAGERAARVARTGALRSRSLIAMGACGGWHQLAVCRGRSHERLTGPSCAVVQSFQFSDAPGAGIGFLQHENGPCGVLAATVAEIIVNVAFKHKPDGTDPRTLFLEPTRAVQEEGLTWALARSVRFRVVQVGHSSTS